ncbi:MAG: hypothetical protein AAGA54_36325 [Myxococcota bacterium]
MDLAATRWRLLFPSLLALSVACASEAPNEPVETLAVDCGGKCDGLDSVRSLLRDPSDLSLDDLLDSGRALVTDELNAVLASGDLGGFAVDLHDADALEPLVQDMAAAFGERELTTAVNALRLRHLQSSGDTVYAETSLTLDPSTGIDWSRSVEGLVADGVSTARVGFDASATVQARVISAHEAPTDDPIARLQTLRDFAVPRSVADLRSMKPGEAVALRGEGSLGANFGTGVPLLIAEPTSVLTYSVVLSAGLRSRLGGELDVQLLRMDGSELVVDVGISKVRESSAFLAVRDRWGVQGLLESEIEIAGIDVDLGALVDRALQRQLDRRVQLIDALASSAESQSRMTVARLRFDLDADEALLAPAIAQALRGDIRLAQALSHRGEPGIVAELDLLRSGASSASTAGIELFGMSFFRRKLEEQGTIVVQSPAGVRTVMFESLRRDWDWLFSRHGYTRVGMSGLLFDPRNPNATARGEANLVVQLMEGDAVMERDKLLDHVDGTLLAIAGPDSIAALEGPGNEMQRWIQDECRGSSAFDDCPIDALEDPRVADWTAQGMSALEGTLGDVSPEVADLARELGALRLLAQSTFEIQAAFTGPSTTVVVDYRLDDRALETLMVSRDAGDYAASVTAYLEAAEIERDDTAAKIAETRAEIADDVADEALRSGETFASYGQQYRRLVEAEFATVESVGLIGGTMLEVRFPVDANNRPIYAEAAARSLPEARADLTRAMFDELIEQADDWGPHAEQTVGYALLSMLPASQTEVGFDVDMGLEDTFSNWRGQYRAAGYPESLSLFASGPDVAPVDGGLFDIDGIPVVSED